MEKGQIIKKIELEGFTSTCPYCKKKITSLYESQVTSNMEYHISNCSVRLKKEEKKDAEQIHKQ